MTEGDVSRTYDCTKINEGTIDDRHTKEVCDRMTKLYNDLREEIREQLVNQYKSDAERIENQLPRPEE